MEENPDTAGNPQGNHASGRLFNSAESLPFRKIVTIVIVILFSLILIRTAWLNEDAFITFRSVDNLLNGYGPTWNVTERVQTFTHPLWMLLVSLLSLVFSSTPIVTLLFSLLISFVFLLLLLRRTTSTGSLLIIAAGVITSKAFTDYSTSGLENPLAHILLLLFFFEFLKVQENTGKLTFLCLYSGLIAFNRLDHILLVLPALTWVVFKSIRAGELSPVRALRSLAIGFSPLVLWFLFSIFYYGFPLPNTYYAKVNAELPIADRLVQGVFYLFNSLSQDPTTLFLILLVFACAILLKNRNYTPIVAGVSLYFIYLLYIGADYMSGRFLTAIFTLALLVLSQQKYSMKHALLVLPVMLTLGLISPLSPLYSTDSYGVGRADIVDGHDIADERAWQYRHTGLLRINRLNHWPDHPNVFKGKALNENKPEAVVENWIGFLGYYAGPEVHIIDTWALGDPLLSRLPPISKWKPGHYPRIPPFGYINTVRSGENRIADPGVAAFYDKLHLITSGPLFSPDRLATVITMNLGMHDHLLLDYIQNIRRLRIEPETMVYLPKDDESAITSGYFEIDCSTRRHNNKLKLSVTAGINFDVYLFERVRELWKSGVNRKQTGEGPIVEIEIPQNARSWGYDTIFIVPHRADIAFVLNKIQLE